MDDLNALEDWAGALLSRLDPAQRRAVARDVGRELRKSQQGRIKAQQNPDGSPYEPRKARDNLISQRLREKRGRIKKGAMFVKMRTARYLKVTTDTQGIGIGFTGRVARLARVHQEGQSAEVARGGRNHLYPVRQLLGLTGAERDLIRDKLLRHLGA